jgi:3-hydroxyisobutyrate dehydrogenase-like beta-hydroxyacid dehydrogenase
MGLRLLGAGYEVRAYDIKPAALKVLLRAGATAATSPADAADGADHIISSLPRAEDVRTAYLGDAGVTAGLREGAVAIETSTVPPGVMNELAGEVAARHAFVVDAPLTPSQNDALEKRPIPPEAAGASIGIGSAAAGNLCFFVGGELEAVRRAKPVLDLLGIESHHVGPLGTGKLFKLLHNTINLTNLAVISEVLAVARRSGIDIANMVEVLKTTLADSRMLRSHITNYTVRGNFPLGLFPIEYVIKDLGYALEAAAATGVECSVAAAAMDLFQHAANAGYGGYYNPAVYRYVERLPPAAESRAR